MWSLRRQRGWIVPCLAAALVWAQWLTAAYACPQLRGAAVDGERWAALVDTAAALSVPPSAPLSALPSADPAPLHEAAPPQALAYCAEHGPAAMDPEQPQLCKAHCQAGQQTVNSQAGAVDAPPLVLAASALVGLVAALEPGLRPAGRAESRAAGPPRGAPPLYLSLLVLRN
ncbi:MAG: hypothetical protein JNJ89_02325 [Rubrivivax sp.]|nr:hypothetical protein [Rubrivivax sp.]